MPIDTESHIAEYRNAYDGLQAAELIREYEQMEEFGVEIVLPYPYKKLADTKASWGWTSVIAAGVSVTLILFAIIVAMAGRKRNAVGPSDRPDTW